MTDTLTPTPTTVSPTAPTGIAPTIDEQLERYVAMYNETDPDARRSLIDELWTPDAILVNALTMYRGHDEIAAGVARSHDKWVASGHHFAPAGITTIHHNTARFVWNMCLGHDTEPISIGTSFLTFTIDARITSDHQFTDR